MTTAFLFSTACACFLFGLREPIGRPATAYQMVMRHGARQKQRRILALGAAAFFLGLLDALR